MAASILVRTVQVFNNLPESVKDSLETFERALDEYVS